MQVSVAEKGAAAELQLNCWPGLEERKRFFLVKEELFCGELMRRIGKAEKGRYRKAMSASRRLPQNRKTEPVDLSKRNQ